MSWGGLLGSLDASETVSGRSYMIWGRLGMVLVASLGRLGAICGVLRTSVRDFKVPQTGKKRFRKQLETKPLIFDKWCSRVGASMVFKDQSVPSGPKNRPTITAEGVGECMEDQIGGKSGPGVFRTRQSGLESALGRVLVGTKNLGPPPHPCLALISRPHPSRVNL